MKKSRMLAVALLVAILSVSLFPVLAVAGYPTYCIYCGSTDLIVEVEETVDCIYYDCYYRTCKEHFQIVDPNWSP